ncbi:hypothetical protein [Sphingopyxis sp. RIFCSPHIGHO2_12_FULL_65_19]|uniref:hypothetical protein n=1 Tax=Sphingopyxis sp. RIFCSPHIGHO2_12_FULL_65_19 TaxID=1802172 RepID=UPI0008B24126|nr:hypothetical protein [Sphingopyxis sp. RIFCSPHIGHO2_12_FULL_65_19]OHD05054.1 MAG: hypothetical protein A3E77_17430 [Sphingopyxis sp. RIFCSPHIGHO2_12_FULL_65_19]
MDSYLDVDTWHTSHPLDDQRFYKALSKIVRDPKFSPEAMGEYIRDKKGVSRDDNGDVFNNVIDRRITEAYAIQEFVRLGL